MPTNGVGESGSCRGSARALRAACVRSAPSALPEGAAQPLGVLEPRGCCFVQLGPPPQRQRGPQRAEPLPDSPASGCAGHPAGRRGLESNPRGRRFRGSSFSKPRRGPGRRPRRQRRPALPEKRVGAGGARYPPRLKAAQLPRICRSSAGLRRKGFSGSAAGGAAERRASPAHGDGLVAVNTQARPRRLAGFLTPCSVAGDARRRFVAATPGQTVRRLAGLAATPRRRRAG